MTQNYAWGHRREIKRMLREGKFECLLCDYIETGLRYLASKQGAFCKECGCSLYYWPNKETTTFGLSVRLETKV